MLQSCAKVNGFSSKRSSDDDTHEDEIDSQLIRTKCTLRKLFFNDLDKEIWPSENEKINTEVEESISEETKKSSTGIVSEFSDVYFVNEAYSGKP